MAAEQLVVDVLALIASLDDLLHNAKPIRFTHQVRADKQEIYEILDQIRATIPEEIKQARWIVRERQDMLAEARHEAEQIMKQAREAEERLTSDTEVTMRAEHAAEDTVEVARGRAREILLGAEDYAEHILTTLQTNLSKLDTAVQRSRDRASRATTRSAETA